MPTRSGKYPLTWLSGLAKAFWKTPVIWCLGFWRDMTGPVGYRGIAAAIAAYVGVYSIVEASHERQMNLAAFERNMFITMVESGNRGSFVAAMRKFGPVQTMSAYAEPALFEPWSWWKRSQPNIEPLHLWAVFRLLKCEAADCGTEGEYHRIDLLRADLKNSDLRDVGLYDSILSEADLEGADLEEANLGGADLYHANLRDANLKGANIAETGLGGADLRGAKGLTCDWLILARHWDLACRDAALACGESIFTCPD